MKRIAARRPVPSSVYAETKKALKIYKEIHEDAQCRLRLTTAQSIIVFKLRRLGDLLDRMLAECKRSVLAQLGKPSLSVDGLSNFSLQQRPPRKYARFPSHQKCHTEVHAYPIQLGESFCDEPRDLRAHLMMALLQPKLTTNKTRCIREAFQTLLSCKTSNARTFSRMLQAYQAKGRVLKRALGRVERTTRAKQFAVLVGSIRQQWSCHKLVNLLEGKDLFILAGCFCQLRRVRLLYSQVMFQQTKIHEFTERYRQLFRTMADGSMLNTTLLRILQDRYAAAFQSFKATLAPFKRVSQSVTVDLDDRHIRFTGSPARKSPIIKRGILKNKGSPRRLYLGCIDMIIENGEEVEFHREILILQETKLLLIKKNTKNPEELMLLKPRERSNSITKLNVADIVTLLIEEKAQQPESAMLKSAHPQKKLTKSTRSSTSKALIPIVRKDKALSRTKVNSQLIVIMPPESDPPKGYLLRALSTMYKIPVSGSRSVQGDMHVDSDDSEVFNRKSFMRASRSFMIDETPVHSSRKSFVFQEQRPQKTSHEPMHLAILVFAIVSVYGLITSKEIVSALMRVIAGLVAALIVGRIGKMGRVVVLVSMNAAQMYLSESWKDLVLQLLANIMILLMS